MRSGASAPLALTDTGHGIQAFARRQLGRLVGAGLFVLVAFGVASLATWNVADPSFSHATDNIVTNAMGYAGAVFSDLAMQFFGLAAVAALVPAVIWGFLLFSARGVDRLPKRGLAWFGFALLAAAIAGCVTPPKTWPLPTGLGGVFGDMVLKIPGIAVGGYPKGLFASIIAVILAAPALWLFAYGSALLARKNGFAVMERAAEPDPREQDNLLFDEDEDEGDEGILALGAITHWWLSFRAWMHRRAARRQQERDEYEPEMEPRASAWRRAAERVESAEFAESRMSPGGRARVEPEFFAAMVNDRSVSVDPDDDDVFDNDEDEDMDFADEARAPRRAAPKVQNFRSDAATRVEAPAARPVPGARVQREAQTSLIGSDMFEMPSLHFLSEPKNVVRDASLSKDALEQNARLLEGVLEDFGVKGEIIHVRPGPVVTLYELEPAPGIKSSRVIGLSDDIARSMSAIACRVAVVPGRNAIGIELPNAKRETVYLREIMASRDFETTKAKLALALGKTINGEAVIVDIAKMPHVLVAGTTGSGKSVAINTMILSLLYRLTPQECRLIMIDPKMLELSVYDGIPHLLTPVVTDPKKAVVALKWTVREMEDRYRKMSKVGVRNIDGFNARVQQAEKKGEKISRTVQTGFDRQTGEAIYETEDLDLEPMPYIVVIIDEMADLMMVAGKDIEGAVQRLAQMARAAGIHVIMATQRPSVDVITGTIKANFPTRISFQVTSKIDSRTILGEQGAEQLLGMGDMLYMAGGGRIQRVHGPFVSDDEVERVVAHLKLQGVPEYLDAITEDDDEDEEEASGKGGSGGGGGGNFDDSDDPYDQAVAVVLRDGKASTSYIQRRLGIGYNRAASIIEKMEKEGIVGPANHAGKREILVPTEDDKF
ncbi:DNA translocase FtsK [Mesorhizobium sp. M4B.F.Ca.ET.215.01.1.1]|uniref:FtsK/SpoIIIE family DNA translocase n=1 Tax=unclassified Mesorhizobium TaxID=325217 RepID=UPI000FCAE7F2|nr:MULTISPECIES: DNA translocase FtsK [unclassified Mesorhizobium]RUW28312.1 DNA translocase FtsK [Mesorhizobium sp. M4B.F.Ca.ET.013.02.1.1]RVD43265.1 DNA translocase FtsK [Mesorhizobium sp. M4B.F.Ca.ET.019.03.1.1]RWF61847.1 MAG: DNA translocase FtsK [Mesorhizobium sp.]RWX66819.1 DNA translocase FtsK [Mesorhizobium sp. M4B.F.Ca.ET.089.01.1.1]TGQ10691.1 DNA translocase FtsK [Mesorhizobium sp. M4B.F.Ca.ET.215.01.1.1]